MKTYHQNFDKPIIYTCTYMLSTYLNFGESVKPGAIDRVTVGYRTTWTKYAVASAVGIAHELPHFRQHCFLHDGHYGCHLERVHARV